MNHLQGFHVERGRKGDVNRRGYSQVPVEVSLKFYSLRPGHFNAIKHEIIPLGNERISGKVPLKQTTESKVPESARILPARPIRMEIRTAVILFPQIYDRGGNSHTILCQFLNRLHQARKVRLL